MKCDWVKPPKLFVDGQAQPEERSIKGPSAPPKVSDKRHRRLKIFQATGQRGQRRILYDLRCIVIRRKTCGNRMGIEPSYPKNADHEIGRERTTAAPSGRAHIEAWFCHHSHWVWTKADGKRMTNCGWASPRSPESSTRCYRRCRPARLLRCWNARRSCRNYSGPG